MSNSFWVWLTLLATSWAGAIWGSNEGRQIMAILGCAIFFSFFFLAPLFRKKPFVLALFLFICLSVATVVFWPESDALYPNPYLLLIFSIIMGKAVLRLPVSHVLCVGAIAVLYVCLPNLLGYPSWPILFLIVYAAMLGAALTFFHKIQTERRSLAVQIDELLSEYRQLKRSSVASEEMVRQQERTKIARDMHDSVGHKLTALLMQLEIFRLESVGRLAQKAEMLKSLAKESLEETRSAVKKLNQQETVGFQAILHLIRKMEAESFIRVHFSLRQGVLSAPLSNEQSAAIYRAVQEALTNAMRHGSAREVQIEFEAPGGRAFRFEISNPVTFSATDFKAGFGLTAMRERMEQLGGELNTVCEANRFKVTGILPLEREERQHDTDLTR